MNNTPQSSRLHVSIFGETNSGKSSLFNAILGTDTSIVSEMSGTTTDPVAKSMELIPFGPIVLIDTAGINDNSNLGELRLKKTKQILDRTDFALYALDVNDYDKNEFEYIRGEFEARKIPYIIIITKMDTIGDNSLKGFLKIYPNSAAVTIKDKDSINDLKSKISHELNKLNRKESSMIKGLIKKGGKAVLVIPIDSEAPKGRLILPQVQMIRDCIDNEIICTITDERNLKNVINNNNDIDLVITDSQIFKFVSEIVPQNIPLTSFSILMARKKGNIDALISGAEAIKKLNDGSNVLIAEVCTHTKNHEDIGEVKIPNGLKKVTGKNINFTFFNGKDFTDDINKFDLVIHCGGCMATDKEINNRINFAEKNNVPITNYGITLAYINGILDRSIEILKGKGGIVND